MEFSTVGKHCSNPICKQHDYLPFRCETCNEYYCLNHRFHGCENNNNNIVTEKKRHNLPICATKRCKQFILINNICNQCNKNHCINHRFHDCKPKKNKNIL
jgi:hypothetical protein